VRVRNLRWCKLCALREHNDLVPLRGGLGFDIMQLQFKDTMPGKA